MSSLKDFGDSTLGKCLGYSAVILTTTYALISICSGLYSWAKEIDDKEIVMQQSSKLEQVVETTPRGR